MNQAMAGEIVEEAAVPKRICCACGEDIGEMDFFVRYPQGKICSACIVEKNVSVSSARLEYSTARTKLSAPKLLFSSNSRIEQAG